MANSGQLVISLDFELLWGVFDKVDHSQKEQYFRNTRKLIPEMLKIFEQYEISVTWACVGMLFNKSWDEWMSNIPEHLPNYDNQQLSAYRYGNKYKNEIAKQFCFAQELLGEIKKTKKQEIGTHTYSHYYCLEKGQSEKAFESDLKMAKRLANDMGIGLKSLVFPRNQFNSEYLKVCLENGIESVRTNPENWYWQNTQGSTLKEKIFRTGDAYLGTKDKSYPIESIASTALPIQQKASRLLRPKEKPLMDNLKLRRIFSEITYAAKNGLVYHLWWHPHNFGNDISGNFSNLRLILEHFKTCENKYHMSSLNMAEITQIVKTSNKSR